MNDFHHLLGQIGLVDLICALLIISSVIGGLRRRSLLAAIGSGLGTAVTLWLIAGALVVWAPASVGQVVDHSALLNIVPPPVTAFQQLDQLLGGLSNQVAEPSR